MKSLWIFAISTAGVFMVVLGSPAAYGQQEIDPDHFDSPNTKPMLQARTSNSKFRAIRYRGTFFLPYSVLCNGKKLAYGRHSILLRSDGRIGQATFDSNGHSVESKDVVRAAQRKERDQVVVVENSENGRILSVVRVHGFDFVFDARPSAAPSANSTHTGVESLPLTEIARNQIANQARAQATPKPQGD
jgi:hypothetical protein